MHQLRRTFIKLAGATIALGAGLLKSTCEAFAAAWNKAAFEAKVAAEAVKNLGASNLIDSKDVIITAPDIAENGAVVPIAITSKIPNTQSIAIVAEKNPFPLTSIHEIAHGAEAYISVRLKIGETSNVRAIVKADGKYYTAAKEIKVTIGGCG